MKTSRLHASFFSFFLMGGASDWQYFLSVFMKFTMPSRKEFDALTQDLKKILAQNEQ